jgi:hypothetical protein
MAKIALIASGRSNCIEITPIIHGLQEVQSKGCEI